MLSIYSLDMVTFTVASRLAPGRVAMNLFLPTSRPEVINYNWRGG